jgi:anti-anti-sigma regulatory factor
VGAFPGILGPRSALAINLELSHGCHGAAARIEFHDGRDGTQALVEVRGWIEGVALSRLTAILDDLVRRGVVRVVLDCSQLRHIDLRRVSLLIACLRRHESPSFDYGVCGLSPALRDRFRLAGSHPSRHDQGSAEALLRAPRDREPSREWAS